jgi:hypothetical protein
MALNPFDVGPVSKTLAADLATTAGAYAAGDNVGGKLTFENAARVAGATIRVVDLMVLDLANQKIVGSLYLFSDDLVAGSTSTTNAAQVIHADDLGKLVARIPVAAADYASVDTKGVAHVAVDRVLSLVGTSLYGVFVTEGTPTYATSGLKVRLGIVQS